MKQIPLLNKEGIACMKKVVGLLKDQVEMASSDLKVMSRLVLLLSVHMFKDNELIQSLLELLKVSWVRYQQYRTIFSSENPQQLQEALEYQSPPQYVCL